MVFARSAAPTLLMAQPAPNFARPPASVLPALSPFSTLWPIASAPPCALSTGQCSHHCRKRQLEAHVIEPLERQRPTMTFKRRTESRKAVMRKREVIDLRHRINCVGWPCASAVINKERSLTARPGKHAGVQEHGTPDIVMFVIPGRPEWLRRKKNCGREYRPSASPLVPCTPQQYRRTMRVTVSISFSLFKF